MRPRGRIYGATLTAFAVAVTAIVLSAGGGAPAAGAANLFVVPSGGSSSCARASTPVAFASATSGMKCDTWDRAYQAASNGDTVGIRTGSYGKQIFQQRGGGISSPGITFVSDGGTVTTTSSVEFGGCLCLNDASDHSANWITMRGDFQSRGLYFVNVADILLDGWTVVGVNTTVMPNKTVFWGGNTQNITIDNSDICCNNDDSLMFSNVYGPGKSNDDVTIRRTNIHSITRSSGSGVHNECLYASGMPGLTLDRTHWWGCNVMNFNIGGGTADASAISQSNWHIVNSVFECATDLTATDKDCGTIFDGCNAPSNSSKPGWVVEYNWFEEGWYGSPCGDTGITFRGNIMPGTTCLTGATVNSNNVYTSSCGGTNNTVSATAYNSSNYAGYTTGGINQNVRPANSSAVQVDKGSTTGGTYPGIDFDGVTRFLGAAPDAGPFEGF